MNHKIYCLRTYG